MQQDAVIISLTAEFKKLLRKKKTLKDQIEQYQRNFTRGTWWAARVTLFYAGFPEFLALPGFEVTS